MIKRIKCYAYRKDESFKLFFYINLNLISVDKISVTKAQKNHECYYCGKLIPKRKRYINNDHPYCSKQCFQDHYNEKHWIQEVRKEASRLNAVDKQYCKDHHYQYTHKYRIAFVRYNDWECRI